MARVTIEDRHGARLGVELTDARAVYNDPDGPYAAEGWHVLAFEDGRVYEPSPSLHPENAMAGEFATHDIDPEPTRPHVESGLCSCRPRFEEGGRYGAGRWVHAHKRGEPEAGAEEAPVSPQDGSGDLGSPGGPDGTTAPGGEA